MALKAVGARTEGDVYQGLFFWRQAAALLAPNSMVQRVDLEHDAAAGVDDVAVFYKPPGADAGGWAASADYYQLKYHVDRRDAYSAEALADPDFINAKSSLLERFHGAYKKLAGLGGRFRLHLASNWSLRDDDALGKAILEFDGALPDRFFTDGDRTALGKVRERWRSHLAMDRVNFESFGKALRLQLNHFGRRHFREWVYSELQLAGLRVPGGEHVASPYDSLVQAFVMNGTNSFDAAALRELCAREGLLEPAAANRPPAIGIRSFIRFAERIEEEVDSHVCVAKHFEGRHPRLDSSWQDAAASIVAYLGEAERRSALRAQAHAVVLECHGSLAVVAGYELSRNSGCASYPVQKPSRVLWKPEPSEGDAPKPFWKTDQIARDGSACDVAVALSVTHSISADVQRYLDAPGSPKVRLLVNAEPAAGPGPASVKGASQAWRMAGDLVAIFRGLRTEPTARVHLFSSAPNSLLFFLGQFREALGRLELYEFDFALERDGSYQPSVSLPQTVSSKPPEALDGAGI